MIRSKFSRGHLCGEHDVKLLKGPVAGLGEAEPGLDEGDRGPASPEEAGVPASVPGGRADHVRLDDVAYSRMM